MAEKRDDYNQNQIKSAVMGSENEEAGGNYPTPQIPNFPSDTQNQEYSQDQNAPQVPPLSQNSPKTQEISSGMTPSMMSTSTQAETPMPQSDSSFSDPYGSSSYGNYDYDQYNQYNQSYGSISPDTISEIAESAVAEKINPITQKLEKAIDTKNKFESTLSNLDDRLKRIEKIIDKLQLSILDRVGQYVSDVSDLKKEVLETQKTFNSIKDKSHKKHKK